MAFFLGGHAFEHVGNNIFGFFIARIIACNNRNIAESGSHAPHYAALRLIPIAAATENGYYIGGSKFSHRRYYIP